MLNFKAGLLLQDNSSSKFTERAIQAMGGLTPLYYLDFVNNRAIAGGVDVGTISSVPSISGTLDLSSSGHLVDGNDNALIFPVSGLSYPLTYVVEFIRTTDSGGNEPLTQLDVDVTDNDRVYFQISSTDLVQAQVTTGGVAQASVTGSGSLSSVPTNGRRTAARFSTNSVQAARSAGAVGALGTEDTSVTVPASPTHCRIAINKTGTRTFVGYIRRIGIALTAATDAQLSEIATTLNA